MEVEALFGRFVWRGVNIDDVTIHPSRGSRINPTLKQDSTTGEFRFNTNRFRFQQSLGSISSTNLLTSMTIKTSSLRFTKAHYDLQGHKMIA